MLKDRYNLTYGKGKERVKREKLRNPDKAQYHIYDAIKAVLPHCKNEKELQSLLLKSGIETEFKLKRITGEVEGISFGDGNISFKGSQADRKYSHGNLKKEFEENVAIAKNQVQEQHRPEPRQNPLPVKRNIVIKGAYTINKVVQGLSLYCGHVRHSFGQTSALKLQLSNI